MSDEFFACGYHDPILKKINFCLKTAFPMITGINTGEPLETGSMFHGGGLMDSAIHAGFRKSNIAITTAYAIEIDERYLSSSMRNNPQLFNDKTVFINSDIADVHCASMPETDIAIAGVPCLGTSKSGKSKNKLQHAEEHQSAGACFFSYLSMIKASNPAVAIMENVKEYASTASFAVIKSVFGQLGYNLFFDSFIGTDFNTSEKRERLVCVAISKGLDQGIVTSKIGEAIEAQKTGPKPLASSIQDIPLDSKCWKEVTYLKEKEARDIKAGKGFRMQRLAQRMNHNLMI